MFETFTHVSSLFDRVSSVELERVGQWLDRQGGMPTAIVVPSMRTVEGSLYRRLSERDRFARFREAANKSIMEVVRRAEMEMVGAKVVLAFEAMHCCAIRSSRENLKVASLNRRCVIQTMGSLRASLETVPCCRSTLTG